MQCDFQGIRQALHDAGKADSHAGIADAHFVYFSYGAAYGHNGYYSDGNRRLCEGWGTAGCSEYSCLVPPPAPSPGTPGPSPTCSISPPDKLADKLASLTQLPEYTVDATRIPIELQAKALDWLLRQIVAQDSQATVDLVGFSLGGVVASYWAYMPSRTTSLDGKIHRIVLVDSPVGGIPLAGVLENCGIDAGTIACLFWKTFFESTMFGHDVLVELGLPGTGDSGKSIVDKLSQAPKKFSVTAIQSSADYLVNDAPAPLAWPSLNPLATPTTEPSEVGIGAQAWSGCDFTLHDDKNLGGQPITAPLAAVPLATRLLGNHGSSITDSETARLVTDSIKGASSCSQATPPPGNSANKPAPRPDPVPSGSAPVDLIIAIDTTGSMGPYISTAKSQAAEIVNALGARSTDFRVALVDYKDFPPPSGPGDPGDYPYRADLPFTTDKSAFISAVQSLSVGGGGDIPEAVLSALMQSIKTEGLGSWRSGVSKAIIFMGDAPPHDPEPITGYTASSVIDAAKAVDPAIIDAIPLGNDPETSATFTNLARGTGGDIFPAASPAALIDSISKAIQTIAPPPPPATATPQESSPAMPVALMLGLGVLALGAIALAMRRPQGSGLALVASGGVYIPLVHGTHTLGRDPDCDILLEDERASRWHARVTVDRDGTVIEDLGSANGTFVNGAGVLRAPINQGDVIRLGNTELQVREEIASE